MQVRLSRTEVPADQTWNLGDLFASPSAWAQELESIEQARPSVSQYQGRLGESAATLLACLDARESLQQRLVRASTFAYLRNASDGTSPDHQAALARVSMVEAGVEAGMSFVDPEILRLPEGTVQCFQAEEPGVAVYNTALHDLMELRPHVLGEEAEKVLASLDTVLSAPYSVYSASKSSDIQFPPFTAAGAEHTNSFNLYEWVYEGHPDPQVRRSGWASFCKGLKAYNNTYATTFATEVNKNVVLARLRGYKSAEHLLLQPHKIAFDQYAGIVATIQEEIAPHMRRYARLRRRVLGLDKMLYCDIKAPLDLDYAPKISFEEAGQLILDSLAVMGEEYCGFIRTAFERRWIDRADNVGKSSGAFCASPYGVHPFILVTWTGSMRDAFVLTHELGHGSHFGLAMKHQRYVNTRPAMPFVEAPSIMHEMLLARHILSRSTDPRMRRWVITQVLGTYHHNFVTHLLEAQLLRQVYALAGQGQSITAAVLNQHKGEILAKFWGDAVEIDEGAKMTWMRQPHYYMGLYPYTYSVGLAASTAMAKLVADEGPAAVQRWLEVLKAGGTMRPLDLLRAAGVDMSTPEPVRSAVAHVGSLVDELEHSIA